MALSDEGTSFSNSSFNSTLPWKYHVFLSFSGDTRKNFTDFLYAALSRKGIHAYRDEEQLERGEIISEELHKAIEESLAAIVVLSPKYATSAWCLNELQIIVESKKLSKGLIFPIFYDVEPSDVRHQKGIFAEVFTKHEERYREDTAKVERWRQAIRKVAELSGYPSKDRHQSELVEEIVAELWKKLRLILPSHYDGLVGIHSRTETMLSLLSEDFCFVGIWGMGGLGKTTLARVVYERIRNEFEVSCFLSDVRHISGERDNGLVELQGKLLSRLKIHGLEIEDLFDGKNKIRNLLFNKKVLLVLDDISAKSQLENLAADKEWFGPGSRVIITTRDKQLLTMYDVFKIYPMPILNNKESLQLFCQKAFKDQPEPDHYYMQLSRMVVHYAGGLPLALEVLGSFLCGRSIPEWENNLDEITKFPTEDIMGRLRISYEALDDNKKNIFLNVACFFNRKNKSEVTHILDVCDLYPTIGIYVLLERSLLTFHQRSHDDDDGYLRMHDLLVEMAIQIIIQESHNDVGKFSRLWLYKDIDHVLTKAKGTEAIHGIVYSSYKRYKSRWNPNAFLKMRNVKLLKFKNLDLPLSLKCLPEGLKYLEWEEFPLQELPLGVQLDEVVELKMHCSKIKTLWRGTQSFKKLKFIDLRDSKHLNQFPSVLEASCVERLVLEGCINLVEVHKSVGQLKMLKELNLRNCVNLKILPNKLEMSSLKNFILSSCSKLKRLPEFGECMEFLEELDLSNCRSLVSFPRSIDKLKSLRILNISGCSKVFRQPENLKKSEDLEELKLSRTAMEEVPHSIMHLKYLKRFSLLFGWLMGRHHISSSIMVPPISFFPLLKKLDLSYCDLRDESLPPEMGCLSSLSELDLSGNNFTELPASCIANLTNLYQLKLNSCASLKSMPKLPPNIGRFYGLNCTSLVTWSDQECLLQSFATHSDEEQEENVFSYCGPVLFFPGTDIPPWFSNRKVQIAEQDRGVSDSAMSIIVEIPDCCLSSERWGIAVCLVLENQAPASTWSLPIIVSWDMKLPGATNSRYPPIGILYLCNALEMFRHPHLCTFLMGNECHINIRPNLKRDQNKFHVSFKAFDQLGNKLNVSKCGWRVIREEDLQVWWDKARSEQEQDNGFGFDMPSTSSSRHLYKARVREIDDGCPKIPNDEDR